MSMIRKMQKDRKTFDFLIAAALLALCMNLALFVAADTPLGTIVIYGINGTELTGSRNVLLNLSYSSSDGIDKCRWVNDDQSALSSADWEECTTAKAWILSSGFGNKTVYFEVKDLNSDTAVFNDSILYVFMQDYTAPAPPTVPNRRIYPLTARLGTGNRTSGFEPCPAFPAPFGSRPWSHASAPRPSV